MLCWTDNQAASRTGAYTIKLFEADANGLPTGEAVETLSAPKGASSVTTNALLSKASKVNDAKYTPSYLFTVTPYGETAHVTGKIYVYPVPAKVSLSEKNGRYFTYDEQGAGNIITIKAEISDYIAQRGSAGLRITKNGAAIAAPTLDINGSGVFETSFSFDDVGSTRLKDVYAITVFAENDGVDAESSDSFVLQVYNKDKFKLDVTDLDGRNAVDVSSGSLLLSNHGIASIAAVEAGHDWTQADSEAIVALNRQIYLAKNATVGYAGLNWNIVDDRMAWASSDESSVTVNYRPGSSYENVSGSVQQSFRYDEKMLLAGLEEGSSTLTVEHLRSGNTITLNTTVERLDNQLYLFRCYPADANTEINYKAYTNAAHTATVERSFHTNADGEFAVYEKYGIASDVLFTLEKNSPEELWKGHIAADALLSGETDAAREGTSYPINALQLKETTNVTLRVQKPDGTPYASSSVTYNYGVFENGVYNSDVRIDPTDPDLKRKATVNTDSAGCFTVRLDSSYIHDVSADLRFLFELEFADGSQWLPTYVESDPELRDDESLRAGEAVVRLKSNDGAQAFIDSFYIDYGEGSGSRYDVTYSADKIGITDEFPEIKLDTRVIWTDSAAPPAEAEIRLLDGDGVKLNTQRQKLVSYQFAKYAVSENTLSINASTGLEPLDKSPKNVKVQAFCGSPQTLAASLDAPFMITSLRGAPALADQTVMFELGEISIGGKELADASVNSNGYDDEAKSLFSSLTAKGGNGLLPVKVSCVATSDPSKWNLVGTIALTLNNTPKQGETDPTAKWYGKGFGDFDKIKSDWMSKAKNNTHTQKDLKIRVTGYLVGQLTFDEASGEWGFVFLEIGGAGGFDASASSTSNVNIMEIPCTFTFSAEISADVSLSFAFAHDQLTRSLTPLGAQQAAGLIFGIKAKLTLEAFGGVGFDYDVIAAKMGLYGNLIPALNFKVMDRGHGYLYGQLKGSLYFRIALKAFFLSYEKDFTIWNYCDLKKLLLGELSEMEPAIKSAYAADGITFDSITSSQLNEFMRIASSSDIRTLTQTIEGASAFTSERRDYLTALGATAYNTSADTFAQKAYPFCDPVVSRDGQILVYLTDSDKSDLNCTGVAYATLSGGSYTEQGVIDGKMSYTPLGADSSSEFETPASNVDLDGVGGFTVAAWEQQSLATAASPGQAVSAQDVYNAATRSEIVAGVYDGSSWALKRITDDSAADVRPVVATNGKTGADARAIVVWRQVASAAPSLGESAQHTLSTVLAGEVGSRLYYSRYNGGTGLWSAPKVLDMGDNGSCDEFDVALADDDTAAVVYTVERGDMLNGQNAKAEQLVICTLDSSGSITKLRESAGSEIGYRTPQIASVGAQGVMPQRFVASAFADKVVQSGLNEASSSVESDVCLWCFDGSGNVYDDVPDSLSALGDKVDIQSNYRLAQSETGLLTDLALVWTDTAADQTNSGKSSDSLYAVRLISVGSRVRITSPHEIGSAKPGTTIDHFTAYVSGDDIKSVKLESSDSSNAYLLGLDGSGAQRYVNHSLCSVTTASATFTDSFEVSGPDFAAHEVKKGYASKLGFNITNSGRSPITSCVLTVGTASDTVNLAADPILPNTTRTIYLDFAAPDTTADLSWELVCTMGAADVTRSGSFSLYRPDLTLGTVRLVKESDLERVIQLPVYNLSDKKLAGSGCSVKLTFDAGSGVIGSMTRTISDAATLALIDAHNYTASATYAVPASGIPAEGLMLNIKAVVLDSHGDETELMHYTPGTASIKLERSELREKRELSLTAKINDANTEAVVCVHNLTMNPLQNGVVTATLLDSQNGVLGMVSERVSAPGTVSVAPDSSAEVTLPFGSITPSALSLQYTEQAADGSALLASLTLAGAEISPSFDSSVTAYTATLPQSSVCALSAVSRDPAASVRINSAAAEIGASACSVPLVEGENVLTITVTNGSNTETYTLTVNSTGPHVGDPIYFTGVGNGGWYNRSPLTVGIVVAPQLASRVPEYTLDGGASWQPYGGTALSLTGDVQLAARVSDAEGYTYSTQTYELRYDGEKPVISDLRVSGRTVSCTASDALSGIASVTLSANGKNHPMLLDANGRYSATLASSASSLRITACDLAANVRIAGYSQPSEGGSGDESGTTTPSGGTRWTRLPAQEKLETELEEKMAQEGEKPAPTPQQEPSAVPSVPEKPDISEQQPAVRWWVWLIVAAAAAGIVVIVLVIRKRNADAKQRGKALRRK